MLATLDKISEEVHSDVLRQRLYFKTVTIKMRYENFETHTHGKTLAFMTDRLQDLKKTGRELTKDYFRPDRKIRLIGLRVSNFTSAQRQQTLF